MILHSVQINFEQVNEMCLNIEDIEWFTSGLPQQLHAD